MIRRTRAAIRRAGRFIRRRIGGGALILLYHRVAVLPGDPYDMTVTPAHFAEQLDVLVRAVRPVGLPELREMLAEGRVSRRAVALTFDDGYVDLLYTVKPLLERHGIPATAFLTTGILVSSREFWWDELEKVLQRPELPARLRIQVDGITVEWDAATGDRNALFERLYAALLSFPEHEQRRVLDDLIAVSGADPVPRPAHRPLTAVEVPRLAQGGLVGVGAHSITHPVLAILPPAQQRTEIQGSRERLEELTGHSVREFAYPFGRKVHYTGETVAIVRDLGFELACSNFPGPVYRGVDPLQLPRYLARDLDGDRFTRWLQDLGLGD